MVTLFDLDPDVVASANAICRHSPVKMTRLSEAVRAPGTVGVWGGTTERQRRLRRTSPEERSVVPDVHDVQDQPPT